MEENKLNKLNKGLANRSANKPYQSPAIIFLGELAVGNGDCGTGSGDTSNCTHGPNATGNCDGGLTPFFGQDCINGVGPTSYKPGRVP